jgi:hypothetical protein
MSAKVLLNGRVLTALVMLLIFASMSGLAFDFPQKGRLMPLMIGIPATLLALVQLILEIRSVVSASASINDDSSKKSVNSDEIHMFMWTFLFFIGILCFGFVYASPVLVFGYLYIGSKESILTSIVAAVSTWLVIYVTFEVWFQIPLFSGLILEWLIG